MDLLNEAQEMLTATGQSLTTAFDEDELEAEFASLSVAGVASKETKEEEPPTVSLESPAVDSKAPRKDAFVPLKASQHMGTSQPVNGKKKKATKAVAVPSL